MISMSFLHGQRRLVGPGGKHNFRFVFEWFSDSLIMVYISQFITAHLNLLDDGR